MEKKLKFSAITGSLGKIGDRYCLAAYKSDVSFEEKLEWFKKIPLLSGLELCYNIDGDESDPVKVSGLAKQYGYEIPVVNAPLASEPKWKFGTFTSKDLKTRRDAVKVAKMAIDFAEAAGCDTVNLWLGQDGFDYCFQVDYRKQWEYIKECISELAEYKPSMKLLLEPKLREPRNRSFIDTAATALLLIKDINKANLSTTIDLGHVLQTQQNMSQVLELCNRFNLLGNIHVNDNYSTWDDDMILGSVHFVEFIEVFFTLRKMEYDGWLSVDIFPFRENSLTATSESILYMQKFDDLIDIIGYDKLKMALESDDAGDVFTLIRERCFK